MNHKNPYHFLCIVLVGFGAQFLTNSPEDPSDQATASQSNLHLVAGRVCQEENSSNLLPLKGMCTSSSLNQVIVEGQSPFCHCKISSFTRKYVTLIVTHKFGSNRISRLVSLIKCPQFCFCLFSSSICTLRCVPKSLVDNFIISCPQLNSQIIEFSFLSFFLLPAFFLPI